MIDSILVATDGSEAAASAERFGVSLARRLGARLAGITVIEDRYARAPADAAGLPPRPEGFEAWLKTKADAVSRRFSERARAEGVEAGGQAAASPTTASSTWQGGPAASAATASTPRTSPARRPHRRRQAAQDRPLHDQVPQGAAPAARWCWPMPARLAAGEAGGRAGGPAARVDRGGRPKDVGRRWPASTRRRLLAWRRCQARGVVHAGRPTGRASTPRARRAPA
jgi:hypothetical protein